MNPIINRSRQLKRINYQALKPETQILHQSLMNVKSTKNSNKFYISLRNRKKATMMKRRKETLKNSSTR
jgi:hypothetical protein